MLTCLDLLYQVCIAGVVFPEHVEEHLALAKLFLLLVLAPLLLHGTLTRIGLKVARCVGKVRRLVLQEVGDALLLGDLELLQGHAGLVLQCRGRFLVLFLLCLFSAPLRS